jgi:hypothetical protein
MVCEDCGKRMRRYGQVAFCENGDCEQYAVRVLIGD